ncbi:ATP-binding cassette domain-containing protein [Fluviispira vulneris]|uniref:ATP-binding cassette domain-containing protein n=1 Tax=Fluviispira vulneris TaxID=2763012 RepID=UPI00164832A8|nr:ATP-binding cassette domain-containing protein [Fluviispira vulneris]
MNFIKTLFFTYLSSLLNKKNSNWSNADLPQLDSSFSNENFNKIKENINYKNKFLFIKSLLFSCKKQIIIASILLILRIIFSILPLIALYYFITQITDFKNIFEIVFSAILLTLATFLNGIITSQYFQKVFRIQALAKYFLSNYIFLKIPIFSRLKQTESHIINNTTSDIDNSCSIASNSFEFMHDTCVIIGSLILLFYFLGVTAFLAIFMLCIFIPLVNILILKTSLNDENIQEEKDNRIQELGSLYSQIRNIKSYLLEKIYENKIKNIRRKEIYLQKKNIKYFALTYKFISILQSGICILTFSLYIYLDHDISLPILFTCIGLFKTLESAVFDVYEYTKLYSGAKASFNRLFSLIKNSQEETEVKGNHKINNSSFEINIISTNIKLSFKKGESVAVIGKIASGKSLLLEAIAKLYSEEQKDIPDNKMAFMPQTAWIMNASVKENILLDRSDLSAEKYIQLACLDEDLKKMPEGENTLIGENGVNLSGGQKQRIALARTAALNSEIILLDDPLSALDKETAKKISHKLIFTFWKNKSIIISTHNLDYLHFFDRIILLEKCSVVADGTYAELLNSSTDFRDFIQRISEEENENIILKEDNPQLLDSEQNMNPEIEFIKNPLKSYLKYLKTLFYENKKLKFKLFFCIFSLFLLATFLPKMQNLWLSFWTYKSIKILDFTFVNELSNILNISIYAIVGLFSSICIALLTLIWGYKGIQVSEKFHIKSLNKLLLSPLKYIDHLTTGKVINCFSVDLSVLDAKLPKDFQKFLLVLCEIFFFIFTVLIIKPLFLLLILPIVFLQKIILTKYVNLNRDFNRKIALPKASAINIIREFYQGQNILSTVKKKNWYQTKFQKCLEEELRLEITEFDVDMWHCLMCFLNNALLTLVVTLAGIYFVMNGSLNAAILSLMTTWIMIDVMHLTFNFSHSFSEVEQGLISLERVLEFNKNKSEYSIEISKETNKHFIEFKNVYMQYDKQKEYILKDFSVSINQGETVGIVGKSGSGKSSIMSLLLRFYEHKSGKIFFAGKSLNSYTPMQIRTQIALVLQNPQFFSGSIRFNLDPHNAHKDDALYALLEDLELLKIIQALPKGIDTDMANEALKLSSGQKQIFAFARALLKPAKLLLLDEPSANVDNKSEKIIMKKIEELKGIKTVIIIAHRGEILNTANRVIQI